MRKKVFVEVVCFRLTGEEVRQLDKQIKKGESRTDCVRRLLRPFIGETVLEYHGPKRGAK